MSVEKLVPEIRFQGFSGEWKSFSLDEISDVLDGDRGHNYPNGEDLKEQGHTLFLSASNVTKNGFKFDTRQYITQEKSESLGNGKLIVDDIILTSRGSIGHIAWYNEDITKQIPFARINSGMLILRAKNNIAPSVISQYLKSPKGKKKIEVISFGSAQPQLTKASVSKFSVSIPSDKPEQTAIGNTFQKLDNLINQHQQKHDKLSNIKKAMLEKMFPKQGETLPEIRFKGFSGEWEVMTLGDYTTFRRGSFPQPYGNKEWYGGEGSMPFVQVVDVSKELSLVEETKQKISLKAQPRSVFVSKGSVVVTLQGTIGRVAVTQYDSFVDRTILIFESFSRKTDSSFWAYTIQNKFDLEKKRAPGGTIKTITKDALSSFDVLIPSTEEQTAIGNYFQKLDALINQHQQQITKLNNIKQACLSKMFV